MQLSITHPSLRVFSIFAMVLLWAITALAQEKQTMVLTIDQPQTAGISGFRAMWDTPVVLSTDGAVEQVDKGNFGKALSAIWSPARRDEGARPGALVFDAVHRSLLVRFPGAARQIADALANGYTIQKVELALPFKGTELWPEGYDEPAGMSFLGDAWAKSTPRWHAIAWALRKPWQADPQTGPTFNAYIYGVGYWKKFGAQDTTADRFPQQFGPEEVSANHPDGRVDVTALLTGKDFGASIAERLRALDAQGFLVRKWETYDAALWQGGYEWSTARGPQGILIDTPKLIVTLAPGTATRILATSVICRCSCMRVGGGAGRSSPFLGRPLGLGGSSGVGGLGCGRSNALIAVPS